SLEEVRFRRLALLNPVAHRTAIKTLHVLPAFVVDRTIADLDAEALNMALEGLGNGLLGYSEHLLEIAGRNHPVSNLRMIVADTLTGVNVTNPLRPALDGLAAERYADGSDLGGSYSRVHDPEF